MQFLNNCFACFTGFFIVFYSNFALLLTDFISLVKKQRTLGMNIDLKINYLILGSKRTRKQKLHFVSLSKLTIYGILGSSLPYNE